MALGKLSEQGPDHFGSYHLRVSLSLGKSGEDCAENVQLLPVPQLHCRAQLRSS